MDYASHPPPSSHQQSASTTVPITSQSQASTKFPTNRSVGSTYTSTSEGFVELKIPKTSGSFPGSPFVNSNLPTTRATTGGFESIYKSDPGRYAQNDVQVPFTADSNVKTEPNLYESLAAAAALASHAAPLASSSYFYSYDQSTPHNYYQNNTYTTPTTNAHTTYPYASRVNLETTPNPLGWHNLSVGTSQSSAFAHLTAAQQMIISSQYSHLSPHSYFGNNDIYQPSSFSGHNYHNHSVFHHFGRCFG